MSKSASKQSKKNLLNYDSQDSVQMNPYLLEINKNNGMQNQSLYGNFNQNTNSSLSLHQQSQSKNQHKKSESIDFLTQNLQYGKGQYANGFN